MWLTNLDQLPHCTMSHMKSLLTGSDGSPAVHGLAKRRPEMGAQGFTGDSFNGELAIPYISRVILGDSFHSDSIRVTRDSVHSNFVQTFLN